ncbi:hypothetical protein EV1_005644 [Malus domestica]
MYSTLWLKYPKDRVQRWRLLMMSQTPIKQDTNKGAYLCFSVVGSITKLTSFTILSFLLQGSSSLQGGSHVKSLSEGP